MNYSQPPPDVSPIPSMSAPPPPINFSMPPPGIPRSGGMQGSFNAAKPFNNHYFNNHHHNKFSNFMRGPSGMPMSQDDFDGKRLRKSVMRKTVDYNAAIIKAVQVK